MLENKMNEFPHADKVIYINTLYIQEPHKMICPTPERPKEDIELAEKTWCQGEKVLMKKQAKRKEEKR